MAHSLRTRTFTLLPILFVIACGGSEAAPSHPPEPRTVSEPQAVPAPAPAAVAAPDEAPAAASPVTISILNDTDAPLRFDRTFGPASPLSVERLDGALARGTSLDQQDDDLSHRWIATCACHCGPGVCPDCEPPMPVIVTLAPGERYELPWNGLFRRGATGPADNPCLVSFSPAADRYRFTGCAEQGGCARRVARLPATEPIEIRMSARARATTCADLDPAVMQRIGPLVRSAVQGVLRDRPVASCPTTPTCVMPDEIAATQARTHAGECALLAIPRGFEVEYRVHLPLPEGYNGGENFAHFYDPAGARMLRARYEQ